MESKISKEFAEKLLRHQHLVNELRQKSLSLILKVDNAVGKHKIAELTKKIKDLQHGE